MTLLEFVEAADAASMDRYQQVEGDVEDGDDRRNNPDYWDGVTDVYAMFRKILVRIDDPDAQEESELAVLMQAMMRGEYLGGGRMVREAERWRQQNE